MLPHVHVVGVAGTGMNALAQVLIFTGYRVTGSDRDSDNGRDLHVFGHLEALGIEIVAQDGKGVTHDTEAVVVSTAIESDNPDIVAAGRLGVPVVHRAKMLADLVGNNCCVAIAGTSGKTTVAGMIGWILEQGGSDPMVVNGGVLRNWASSGAVGNVRCGRSGLWVIEADESDRSFLNFHPEHAVITNISRDHFELDETMALFDEFKANVSVSIVSVPDDPMILDGFDPSLGKDGISFSRNDIEFRLPLLGRHNAENALVATLLCEQLGYGTGEIRDALSRFEGIQRRLEQVGVARGVTVIDDYAHNPAKIRASWESVGHAFERVHAIWRPHGYGPLRAMLDELVELFNSLCRSDDRLYCMPVYYAGGTADRSIDSDHLVERLQADGTPCEFAEDYGALERRLVETVREGDAVLVMGARDPELPLFCRQLLEAVMG